MKLFKTLMVTAAILMIASFTVFAEEAKVEAKKDAPLELKNQTHCPVMGGKIDSTVFTDIQGQRVYHCCPGCSTPLVKNPDKFFKKAASEGVLFENIQSNCPVSGEKLEDKSVFADFEGRRIAFCCKKCRGTFNEEPMKFLFVMDAPKEEAPVKEMKTGHEGHNH